MKVLIFFLAASTAIPAGWDDVQRIPQNSRIEVSVREARNVRGSLVSVNEAMVVMRSNTGEQSIRREDVRRVKVADPSRRLRSGLIGTAIGAGAGLAIGVAVCPHCANEGSPGKFTGPLTAIGAGAGAVLGSLPSPYRTVYKSQ